MDCSDKNQDCKGG